MTIYKVGSVLDEFDINNGCAETTGKGDAAWSATQIRPVGGAQSFGWGSLGGLTSAWFHAFINNEDGWNWGASGFVFISIYDTTGVERIRLQQATDGIRLVISLWNGTSWSVIGNPYQPTTTTAHIDIQVVINGASSVLRFFVAGVFGNGSPAVTITGWTIGKVLFFGVQRFAGDGTNYSQMIVADVPTINYRYCTRQAATLGANSDWVGSSTVANITKTNINDATFIEEASAAGVTSYLPAASALVAGSQVVKGVKVCARGRVDGVGPQHVDGVVRLAGVNYFTADVLFDVAFKGVDLWFNSNPATAAGWTPAIAGTALEFGVRSAA